MFFAGACALASKKIHKSLIFVLAEECFPQIGIKIMLRALHNLVRACERVSEWFGFRFFACLSETLALLRMGFFVLAVLFSF